MSAPNYPPYQNPPPPPPPPASRVTHWIALVGLVVVLAGFGAFLYWRFFTFKPPLQDGAVFMVYFTSAGKDLEPNGSVLKDMQSTHFAIRSRLQMLEAQGRIAGAWRDALFTPQGKEIVRSEVAFLTVRAHDALSAEEIKQLNTAWDNYFSYKDKPESAAAINRITGGP